MPTTFELFDNFTGISLILFMAGFIPFLFAILFYSPLSGIGYVLIGLMLVGSCGTFGGLLAPYIRSLSNKIKSK